MSHSITAPITQARDAYQLALANGFVGTLNQWLDSLSGATGPAGPDGPDGPTGPTGPQGPTGATGPALELTSGPVRSTAGTSSIADNALTIAQTSGLQVDLNTRATITGSNITDPAAFRVALQLGTAAQADAGSLVPAGPYADAFAAILSGAVQKDALYRQPSGIVSWLGLNTQAADYQDAHGISDRRALLVSGFFEGLADLGLLSDFKDGAIYRADSQPASGATLPSLLGLSNQTMFNTPVRERHGIYFGGTNQYATGSVVATTGARTFIGIHSGVLGNTDATLQPIFRYQNGESVTQLTMNKNGTAAGQAYSYVAVARTTAGSPGWNRESVFAAVAIRDDATAGASSFSMRRLMSADGTIHTRVSTQGEASHTLNKLRIVRYANNDGSTNYTLMIERVIPGWFIFGKSLDETESENFNTLLGQTLFPKWKMVWEGDSITNYVQLRALDKGCWRAANVSWQYVGAGGETSVNGVAQIGTGTGLNTTNLADTMPTVVDIAFGANDLGNFSEAALPFATIHANLRTLWAYARSTNPNAVVCAHTVMQSSYITARGREANREALNALIRADAGVYYDILQDRDAWSMAATALRPVYLDASLFIDDDAGAGVVSVHPTSTIGGGADQLANYMSANLIAAGVIP